MAYKLNVRYRKTTQKDSVDRNSRVAAQHFWNLKNMSKVLAERYCSHTVIVPSAELLQAENWKIL